MNLIVSESEALGGKHTHTHTHTHTRNGGGEENKEEERWSSIYT